jgi:hypothetical protein
MRMTEKLQRKKKIFIKGNVSRYTEEEAGREWNTEENTQRRNNLVFFTFGFRCCCRRRVAFQGRIQRKCS